VRLWITTQQNGMGARDARDVQKVKSPDTAAETAERRPIERGKKWQCVPGPAPGRASPKHAVLVNGQIEGKAVDQFHFLRKITDEIPGRATRTERALNVD
jgi:hypothetical protein